MPSQAADREVAANFIDVTKTFAGTDVLSHINLEVPAGQRLTLIGPSGSGKTTLLRVLMTLERPSHGVVEVFGQPLGVRVVKDGKHKPDTEAHLRSVRGQIGMVFQHFNLFPHRTAMENVTEGLIHVLKMPRSEAEERARDLLTQVGLQTKFRAFPRQLSGGQQQRVAIARALAMHPRIMLFDEVTSALDPELVGEVLEVMRNLTHSTNMTMLIVTHEMSFARDVSDRVLFLEHGSVVEDGPPEEIFTSPSSERTRSFLRKVLER
jgi:polar amino acid transport system ATP-binding protein